ncbi:MAG: IclR family transcriptional regulator [Tenericutes bacterium]|nr:IclR family transcriptional regulator [Mycoplasmatota bacterium]
MKINNTTKKTIEILEIISKNPGGLTLNDVANQLDLPKSTVFDILATLKSMDIIKYADERLKNFVIGTKLFIIGNSYIENDDLINSSKHLIKELGDKLGRTIFIGQESQGKILYLYKYEPDNAIITTSNIGSTVYLYNTALGKSILAYREDQDQLIKNLTYKKFTKNTITNEFDLREELKKVKACGYAIDNREVEEHLSCIGAPIFNHKGEVIAAVSASGLYTENIDIEYISRNITETAYKISERMGYQVKKLF